MNKQEHERRDGLVIAEAIRKIDDKLGQFSDHEGNEDGPTYHLWQLGKRRFAARCDEAIELHQRAIRLWKDARLINAKRSKP